MKVRVSRILCTAIMGAAFSMSGSVHAEALAANDTSRILAIHRSNLRSAPTDWQTGGDAVYACVEMVFLEWHELYSRTLATLPGSEGFRAGAIAKFKEAEQKSRGMLEDVIDLARPRLKEVIRKVLDKARAENKAPALPAALSLQNIEEGQFNRNMSYCRNEEFIQMIAKLVPPPRFPDQPIPRTVMVEVAEDFKTGAVSFYVPTRKVPQTLSLDYSNWLKFSAEGN